VPQARGGKRTKAVVEYDLLAKRPYTYTEEEIAFQVYAVIHNTPKASQPNEREKLLGRIPLGRDLDRGGEVRPCC
jgi:hypothetical protein